MATSVVFTPLYGAKEQQPLSYLLEINNLTILLDCGWTEEYDTTLLQPLVQVTAEPARSCSTSSSIVYLELA